MHIERCFECGDLGFTLRNNALHGCWRFRARAPHNAPNAAAVLLARSVEWLMIRKLHIDTQHFEIAKLLTRYNTERPFDRAGSLENHFAMPLRSFMGIIEDLRKIWLLPVGSRKFVPAGYWIITDEADFKAWVDRCKAAPITQLSTIAAVARRNFPIFAEQLELDFWQEMHGSDSVRQAA